MSGTYFLGGVMLLLAAVGLMVFMGETFWPAALTVIQGSLLLGLVFFGLVFIYVGIEDLK